MTSHDLPLDIHLSILDTHQPMAPPTKKTRGLVLRGKVWYYNVSQNGREVIRSTGQTSKAAALLELEKIRTIRNEGKSILERKRPDRVLTFGALCDQWYTVHLSQKRMNGAVEMLNIWKRGIGISTLLKNITSTTIVKFLEDHAAHCKATGRGFGASSRNRHVTMMHAMWRRGLKEKWMSVPNPTENIDRLPESIGRTRFLTVDEVTKLLSDEQTPLWLREFMTMALHTGMRAGEMKALKWTSVNLTERIITIRMDKRGIGRQLDISDTLLEVLKRRHAVPGRGSLVFPSPKPGHQETPLKNYDDSFRLALGRAGITDFRWHDLRHTFASHMVMSGADLSTVQACLGHSQQTMTQRYVTLAPNHVKRAVRLLDKVFSGTPIQDEQPLQKPSYNPSNGS